MLYVILQSSVVVVLTSSQVLDLRMSVPLPYTSAACHETVEGLGNEWTWTTSTQLVPHWRPVGVQYSGDLRDAATQPFRVGGRLCRTNRESEPDRGSVWLSKGIATFVLWVGLLRKLSKSSQ